MYSTTSPLLTTLLLLLLHRPSVACHPDDRSGLLSFKSGITHDPTGILGSWVPTTDCCSWNGVSCGPNNRVDSLTVFGQIDPGSYLSGTISSSLVKLRYMTAIYLKNTQNITGPFPSFLSGIPGLRYIYIENNKLSGPIPSDIGTRFANLEALSVLDNRFTGRIPNSVNQLTYLEQLVLGGNLLTGPIPDGIRRLRKLGYLNLANNQLSGKIPDFFDSFPNLVDLNLTSNKLSGEIPNLILFLLPKIRYLELGHNFLTGKCPDYNGNFKSLVIFTLDFSYNKLNLGEIPNWAKSSYSLRLARCGLKFNLDTFVRDTALPYEFIDLSDNQISGSPINLLNQSSLWLEGFLASGNKLRFNISQLVIHERLRYLNLSRNQIYGKIPASIAGVEKVDLSHNHLCGQIPKTTLSAKAFEGNDCLCGSPLPACKK